jgi:hypothetical protein
MPRKNLFPAGLRIESVAHSIEEMDEQSVFWGLETQQMGRGKHEGPIFVVHSGSVQLARSLRSSRTLLHGNVWLTGFWHSEIQQTRSSFLLDYMPITADLKTRRMICGFTI